MKIYTLFSVVFICLALTVTCLAADAPRSLAGFTLGELLSDYKDRVIMDSVLPIRYLETFQEVEIRPHEGYKSGLIGFGTCHQYGRIVRIKLKYEDSSKAFFKKLLKQYKQRLGDPTEYNGDAFQVFISWKWNFTDENGQRISLTLQHNESDSDEKIGNAVKLTHRSMVEKELECHRAQEADRREQMRKSPPIKTELKGWDRFVPR
jgi:hypothetical protein